MRRHLTVLFLAVACAATAGADDLVVASGESLTVTDADMASFNAHDTVTVAAGGTLTFNIAGDADITCLCTNQGTVVKTGAGALRIASSAVGYSSGTNLRLTSLASGAFEIQEGELWCPQDFDGSLDFSLGRTTVSSNGTLVTAKSLASDGACNTIIDGLWGDGVVTNIGTSGGCQLRVMNVSSTPCVFSGRIVGKGIRWYSGGNVRLTGTNSNFSGSMQIWSGYNDFSRRGVTGLAKIGNKNEESSVGLNNELASREHGACFLYLGEGETTSKNYFYYNNQGNDGMHVWDAGAHGGVTFTGKWGHGGSSSTRAERLVLTGSNTAPCVISGEWAGDNSAPTYVIKRGTGTWTFADNSSRRFTGGMAVEEGVLRFTSLADTNVVCSLGLATMLQSAYSGTYDPSKNVDYAYLLGGAGKRGVMEYAGSAAVDVSTRPLAVKSEGELRLAAESAGATFRFTGATALAGGGTLVLSGAEGTSGVLTDAADGAGALGIAKEGAGKWRLNHCDDASGALAVKEGTLEVVGVYTNEYTHFKLVIRGSVWSHTGANDSNYCFAGVRFYGPDGQPLTGETNMTFRAGEAASNDMNNGIEDPSVLQPGQYAWLKRAGYYKKYTTRDIDRMFGLVTSDNKICVAWYTPSITHNNPASWASIQMRMPSGIGRVAAFDVRSNYGPTNGRALSDWTLLASEDGSAWDEVAKYDYDAATMPPSGRWFSDGTDDKDIPRPGKGYSTLVAYTNTPLARFSTVTVASNATLRAVGSTQLNLLTLDCASGAGTVEGFEISAVGRLDVLNAPGGSATLPGAFTNCTDMDNFKRWDLFIDGQRARNFGVIVSNGQLRLVSKGTTIVVR